MQEFTADEILSDDIHHHDDGEESMPKIIIHLLSDESTDFPGTEVEVEGSVGTEDPVEPGLSTGAQLQQEKIIPASYHKASVKLYLGSSETPMWDLELLNNVMTLDADKMTISRMMADIIANYGSKIFVYKAKSSTKEELNELIQLQFCIMRNLHRGTRVKTAEVPISSLLQFGAKLGSQQAPIKIGQNPRQVESVPDKAGIRATQGPVGLPTIGRVPGRQPMKFVQSEAITKVADAYKYGPFDPFGKPRINKSVASSTLISHPSVSGSNSGIDPCNTGEKGLPYKLAPTKKCKTMN